MMETSNADGVSAKDCWQKQGLRREGASERGKGPEGHTHRSGHESLMESHRPPQTLSQYIHAYDYVDVYVHAFAFSFAFVFVYVTCQPSHLTTYLLEDMWGLIYTIYTGFTKFINRILYIYVFETLLVYIVLCQAKKIQIYSN
jgi:hypothetical protein